MPEFEYRLRISSESRNEANLLVGSLSGNGVDNITVKPVESVLSQELAQRINAACGGSLPDETLISDLRGFSLRDKPKWQNPPEAWVNVGNELTVSEKKQITAIVSACQHSGGYETVGQVRSASFEDLTNLRTISDTRASFIRKVFEKPIDPELAIRAEHV